MKKRIIAESYFDGYTYHKRGPYGISIDDNKIIEIEIRPKHLTGDEVRTTFCMPGMTEAHCHLFLDGGELDFQKRAAFLKSDFEVKVKTALNNLEADKKQGITFLCDAGDSYGVNQYIQKELNISTPGIRQAGMGIRKRGRYGGFMARHGSSLVEYEQYIQKISLSCDVLKIVLTGIIDFEKGQVKGNPQFSYSELQYMVNKGKEFGLDTMVHCSGVEGLEIAVEAGVNSIEHGFFMNRELLAKMRDKDIIWVPTFIPVHFQYANPQYSDWNDEIVGKLGKILDDHKENLSYAREIGVSILIGSDAGSYGVSHGKSYIEELYLFKEAGVPVNELLNWATVKPRGKWGIEAHDIKPGNNVDIIMMDESPFDDFDIMKKEKRIF